MPLPSSSPPLSRGEEGEKGSGGCGADGNNGSLLSAPVQQKQQQRQELVQGSGKGTEQSIDLLLRRDLSNFVAALPACWRSRQRVSDLGLALADLLPECIEDSGREYFPDCYEEEEEEEDDQSGPTLALLAFCGPSGDDTPQLLLLAKTQNSKKLGTIEAPPSFQVLAACVDERGAEELASRLRDGESGGGSGGGNRKNWAWRPLSRSAEAGSSLLVQLFRVDVSTSSSLLVASDYDHTLVDDNSDTLVVAALGASETLESLWSKSKKKKSEDENFGWTEAVDAALRAGAAATARRLFARGGGGGGGREDPEQVVLSSAASAPCHAALRCALLSVCGRKRRRRGPGDGATKRKAAAAGANDFAIFSDANDVFIEAGLRGNGLLSEEDGGLNLVATNPARFVDVPADNEGGNGDGSGTAATPAHRRLALSRASERYRGCGGGGSSSAPCPLRLCPANLCKGRLLARLVVAGPGAPYARGVIYMGDGANDVCPAASCLGATDAALVRERYGKEGRRAGFGAAVLLTPAPKTRLLCRSVVPWSTQEELAEALVREARKRGEGFCTL